MSDTKFVPAPNQNFLALPLDTVIGRYRVTGILGQGSFGITYRAHDSQLGRDVAIKEYLPTSFAVRHDGLTVLPNSTEAAEDFAWGRQRFVEEGRTLAGFQRAPGIVRVHDFLEANGTAYIVMELATGETLGARLQRQGRLAAAEVERILRALLDGLEKVHAASFIHRDIKPDNILLDDEGQPTLIDFGAARAAVAGRTSALTGIFTPGYAAVEQFTDGRQGPFTDIYALSATLYQSIAGEKPPSAIDRVLEDKCVPLAKRRPAGFAPALLAGIDRGMAVRPEARPQSIAAWRALLFPGETREKPIPVQAPAKPARWRVVAIAGLATVLVAGAAAGALFLFAPQKAPVTDTDRQQAERSAAAAAAATAEKQRAEEETQRQAAAAAAEKRRADEEAQRRAADAAASTEKQRRADEEAQRQAAAAAAEKRGTEEETQRRAAAEQARRQQSEADARQQAEATARQQVAAEEAQRKADEDARATTAAEEARRESAEAEQRQAARRLADQEAREQEAREKAIAEDNARNAEAGAEKAKAEAEAALDRKTAETAEAALHLGPVDRERVQVALTAQGFDTRGTDGVLGPRSREMVAAWQTAHSLPATGFLDAAQRQRLLGGSTAALTKFDAEQKKAAEEEARRREQARPDATSAAVAPSRRVPETSPSAFAGRWSIVRSKCSPSTPQRFFGVTVEGNRFTYGFSFASRTASCTVAIGPDGSFANNACEAPMSGRISGNRMTVSQRHPEIICDFEFQKQ
jgi:hypothetical protein